MRKSGGAVTAQAALVLVLALAGTAALLGASPVHAFRIETPPAKVSSGVKVFVIEWIKGGDVAATRTAIDGARDARIAALACLDKLPPADTLLLHVQVRKGAFAVVDDVDPDVVSCLAAALGKAAEPGVDLRLVVGHVPELSEIVAGRSEAPGLKAGALAGAWKKWQAEMRACVTVLRARSPGLTGVGELILRVAADGTVVDASAVGAPALSGDPGGRDCISVVPLGWKLAPAPLKGKGGARIALLPLTIGGSELRAAGAAAAGRKLDHAGVLAALSGAPLHPLDDAPARPAGMVFALEAPDTEKIQTKLAEYFDCHGAAGAGTVELLVHLSPDGDFDDARVVRLAGPALLEECALTLVFKTRLGAGGRTGWAPVKLEKK
jgi:hypothetical protein